MSHTPSATHNVQISGVDVDTARNVLVTSQIDGDDASFEITLDDSSIDPILFGRPSPVTIHQLIDGQLRLIFDGFIAEVEDQKETATVRCVDGKKLLEKSMLETIYHADTLTLAQHAQDLLDAVAGNGYYAPALDCGVNVTINAGDWNDGSNLREIFDILFKGYEWVVWGGAVVVREKIGEDKSDEILIKSNVRTASTDFLSVVNVQHGNDGTNVDIKKDQAAIEAIGYALGATERVNGKTGTALGDHLQALLDQKKTPRTIWSTTVRLKDFKYLLAGDTVSVDLPSTAINTAPATLRVAQVVYDLTRKTQEVALTSDAILPPGALDQLKNLRDRVRQLEL